MTAEIISIGTELLLGQIVDTDAAYLARALSAQGVSVYHRTTVGDNLERATQALTLALSRADAVFCIGGLGPTLDDLTRPAISAALGVPLVRDPAIVAHLTEWFERRNYPLNDTILLQADVPEGGVPLPNPNGTAPGLWVEAHGKLVVALPGPPSEFEPMVEEQVLPRIAPGAGGTIRSKTLRIIGMGESSIEEKVKDLMAGGEPEPRAVRQARRGAPARHRESPDRRAGRGAHCATGRRGARPARRRRLWRGRHRAGRRRRRPAHREKPHRRDGGELHGAAGSPSASRPSPARRPCFRPAS